MKVDLGELNAFLAVARAGGFRDGARASGTSASGLSEAVRRLEAKPRVRLLNRTTRRAPPPDGRGRPDGGGRAPPRTADAGPRRGRGGAGCGERIPRQTGRDAPAQR